MHFPLFVTCARGLESVLAQELRELGGQDVRVDRGGVRWRGDQTLLYQANLWLRTGIRVLKPILEFSAESPEELYDGVQAIDWREHLTANHTLAVDANVRDSRITHSRYAAHKVKDAICDQFLARDGRRPSVDVETPMVAIHLHLHHDLAILSLDSSGDSLHKRGYRPILTRAPLNEALAAGLVLLTGWRGTTPLMDPLCGSGTLCLEAAHIALARPPGLTRRRFGFQGWRDFDVRLFTHLRDQARSGVRKRLDHPIIGADRRADVISLATATARAAGLGRLVSFSVADLQDSQPPAGPAGTLICNPPYGERLGQSDDWVHLYQTLGQVLRRRFQGWRAWVFSGNADLARLIDLPTARQIPLYNGKIPCQFIEYNLS